MKPITNFLLSRGSHTSNLHSFILLSLRAFGGLMMLPYGFGKITKYDELTQDFFGDPIGIGNLPSLWLTIFAQIGCSASLVLGFQTRLCASVLAINMLVATKYHFLDPFHIVSLPIMFLGVYLLTLMLGAGRYSLDYMLYEKSTVRICGDEVSGLALFAIACGITCLVVGNCFGGLVSILLMVLALLLYLAALSFMKK